jgi:nucleoside-diphosphate-sugar epimerase
MYLTPTADGQFMELRGRIAVITGAGGFVGRQVARRLAEGEGMRVRALVRRFDAYGTQHLDCSGVEVVRADILDPASLRAAMQGADLVVHAAMCRPGSQRSTTWATIVDGTANVFMTSTDGGARRFIHLSTFDVYFGVPEGRPAEDSPLKRYGNVYGDAKIAAEEWLRRRERGQGPSVVVLRPPFIYGPGSRDGVGAFVDSLRRNRMFLPGGGDFPFPYVYVDNMVDAVVAAARSEAPSAVYNVMDGRVSFKEFLAPLVRVAGRPPRVAPFWAVALAGRGADLRARLTGRWDPFSSAAVRMMRRSSPPLATAEKARRELGWSPRIDFAEGMQRTCDWLTENV